MRAHTWNTDFSWTSAPGGAPTFLSPDQVAQFDRDGFVMVPDVIDHDSLAEVRAELDADEARADELLRQMPDQRISIAESGAITFSPHVVKRSDAARRFAHHPELVGIVADLVGPDARLYWDQLVYKKPDKPREFPWHQDNGYTYVEPQQYLTCWVPLVDATIDNGCPWVVPGLHRRGTLHHEWREPLGFECIDEPVDATPVEVAAGGVVVFSSLTPHKTGPNTTDAVRKTYILQYAPDGSVVCGGDPSAGPPTERVRADAPDRQFPVLVGGVPVTDG